MVVIPKKNDWKKKDLLQYIEEMENTVFEKLFTHENN